MEQMLTKKCLNGQNLENWIEIKNIEDRLFYMYENGIGTDTILKIRNGQSEAVIEVHRCILMANSHYFQAYIQRWSNQQIDGKKVIQLENDSYSVEIIKMFIKTLYKNDYDPIPVELSIALLELLQFYECRNKLKSHQMQLLIPRIDCTNAIKIFQFARKFETDLNELFSQVIWFISTNADIFSNQTEIAKLNEDEFHEILASEDLRIEELKLFNAVLNWGKFQCENNKIEASSENIRDITKELIKLIRFPIIPLKDFATKVIPENLLTREEEHKILSYIAQTSPELEGNYAFSRTQKDSIRKAIGLEFNIFQRYES